MSRLLRVWAAALIASAAVHLPAVAAPTRDLPDFAELADRQGAAVVNISTTQALRQARPGLPRLDEDDPMFDFFRRFVPRQPGGSPKIDPDNRSLGSGFIVSSDGYVLTNAHVVEGADEIIVKLSDKREFRARLMGADPRSDVALLKIEASGLPKVSLGDPGKLRVGTGCWPLVRPSVSRTPSPPASSAPRVARCRKKTTSPSSRPMWRSIRATPAGRCST